MFVCMFKCASLYLLLYYLGVFKYACLYLGVFKYMFVFRFKYACVYLGVPV